MSKISEVAQAFAEGRNAHCHNARTDGSGYFLHRTMIAVHHKDGGVTLNWGGYYTPTTANHMNAVLRAMGINRRVSYAQARDAGHTTVRVAKGE